MKARADVIPIDSVWWKVNSPQAKQFMEEDLARSGLKPADMGAYPVEHKQRLGMPAYMIPYGESDYWRIRFQVPPDYPYGKYKAPTGEAPRLYLPPKMTHDAFRAANVKWICEGEKKAAKLFKQYKVPVVGIAGCWMWGHKVKGERCLLPELQDGLKAGDTVIYIADRDILDPKKLDIGKAAKSLMHVLETSMNCSFQVLLPPEPYKGVDDWMADGHTGVLMDELEEVDLAAYAWFPLKLLQSAGITFKADKDGQVLSYRQAISNNLNSELFAKLIYENNPGIIALDKYRGYIVKGKAVGAANVIGEMVSGVNAYFPEYRVVKDGVQYFLLKYCDEIGSGNCIKEHVEALTWDGTKRLDTWLAKSIKLSANTDPAYASQVGKAMMCAMYSRVMNPGSQQDFMFILVGNQGIGKSQFFRTLGNFPDHQGYQAVTVSQLGQIDYTMGLALKRAVVLDVDDLDNMRRTDQGELKSFVTRVIDTWREIYTTRMVEEPRGFILTGSTNNRKILDDVTGNRRYLTLDVDDIRGVTGPFRWCEALRDQLLAECHALWPLIKDSWWNIDLQVINKNNAMFAVDDTVITAITEMLENKKVGVYNKHEYISAVAISRWIDDPRFSVTAVGMRLAKLPFMEHGPFRVFNKIQVPVETMTKLPDDIRRLYTPTNRADRVWVYPVKVQ